MDSHYDISDEKTEYIVDRCDSNDKCEIPNEKTEKRVIAKKKKKKTSTKANSQKRGKATTEATMPVEDSKPWGCLLFVALIIVIAVIIFS